MPLARNVVASATTLVRATSCARLGLDTLLLVDREDTMHVKATLVDTKIVLEQLETALTNALLEFGLDDETMEDLMRVALQSETNALERRLPPRLNATRLHRGS